MKLTSLDKPDVKLLRTSLEEALKTVAQEHGVSIRVGTIRIDPSLQSCRVPVEVCTVAADGSANSYEADEYKRYAKIHGLPLELLNQTFVDPRGNGFRLIGYDAGRPKNPFVLEKTDGSGRCFGPPAIVRIGFRDRLPQVPPRAHGSPSFSA